MDYEDIILHNLIDKKLPQRKKRKYSEEYLTLGFTSTCISNEDQPDSVICHDPRSNKCMKRAKLRRHLQTKHKENLSKPTGFLTSKLKELKRVRN